MGDFITGLLGQVTVANLWESIAPAAPLVGVGILVGFGYLILRRAVKGIGRGKGTI
jgi:hypothetical protein